MLEYLVRNDLLPEYLSMCRLLADTNYPFPWVALEIPSATIAKYDPIERRLHCSDGTVLYPAAMSRDKKGRSRVLTVTGEDYILTPRPYPTKFSLTKALPLYLGEIKTRRWYNKKTKSWRQAPPLPA
jgi:hypothetical protein